MKALHARPPSDSSSTLHTLCSRGALCLIFAAAGIFFRYIARVPRRSAVQSRNELKAAVLDALAHDAKTPLTSIKASVESLLSGRSCPDKEGELLTIIREEADKLERIIDESIQIARIEFLDLKLERRCYEVRQTIEAALSGYSQDVADRVTIRIPEGIAPVEIDFRLAKLVFRQLVDNALKYSSGGSPVVISAVQNGGFIVLRVRDFGMGISSEDQTRVFKRDFRSLEARNSASGTGVGLAIVKRIVDAHGGGIALTSRPGEGSIFSVALPIFRDSRK